MEIYTYLCTLNRNRRRNNYRTLTTSLHLLPSLYRLSLPRSLFIRCRPQNILDIFTFGMDTMVELYGRQQM